MYTMWKIILTTMASSSVLIGLALNWLMLKYLHKKPAWQKTTLDCLHEDTLKSTMFALLIFGFCYIFGTFQLIQNFEFVSCYSALSYVVAIHFFSTCLILVVGKYCFITYSTFLLEKSDVSIHRLACGIKLAVIFAVILLDQFGPLQGLPLPFRFLAKNQNWHRYSRVPNKRSSRINA